jgi:hypothetical protein
MAMMTLAHRMRVFGVVHHAGVQKEHSKLRWDAAAQAKIMRVMLSSQRLWPISWSF